LGRLTDWPSAVRILATFDAAQWRDLRAISGIAAA
jgi:hypothetical protein